MRISESILWLSIAAAFGVGVFGTLLIHREVYHRPHIDRVHIDCNGKVVR